MKLKQSEQLKYALSVLEKQGCNFASYYTCLDTARQIADYGCGIFLRFKDLDHYLSGMADRQETGGHGAASPELERLMAPLTEELSAFQNASGQVCTMLKQQLEIMDQVMAQAKAQRRSLFPQVILPQIMEDIEKNIANWYQLLKEAQGKHVITGQDAQTIAYLEGKIRITGDEYKRRQKLTEYVHLAEDGIDDSIRYLNSLILLFQLIQGIWRAAESDLLYLKEQIYQNVRQKLYTGKAF